MNTVATSLKLPKALKTRIGRIAKRTGETAHGFMLRAVEERVEVVERYQRFLDDAVRADAAMLASGLGYPAEEVHAYLEAKIAGKSATRPKPARWRR